MVKDSAATWNVVKESQRRNRISCVLGVAFVGLVLLGMGALAMAQPQAPPGVPPAAGAPQTIPEWVVKYANNQEQAARACQLQLAQEQAKLETAQKDLADAKQAAAKAPEKKP